MAASLLKLAVAVTAVLVAFVSEASAIRRNLQKGAPLGTPLEWPGLRFQFTIKKSSMNVFGQSDISMYANPIVSNNNAKVLYDVYATFTANNTLHNYTLVDSVAYFEDTPFSGGSGVVTPVAKCIDSESGALPAVNAIVAAINEAKNASSVSGNATAAPSDCYGGSSYKTQVNKADYTICASGPAGFTMKGADMDISVLYLESQIEVVPPTMDARKCPLVAMPTAVTPIGHSLLTGEPISSKTARKLKSAFDFSLDALDGVSSCKCQSKPRPCVFIHGQGLKPEMPENQDSFPHYWGNLTDHAPCCSSFKYARLDTINNGWTDRALQQKVCDRVLAVSDTSTKSTISDTIVVTHSMGNLVLAGAIANKHCKLDSSSTWVGLAGPMKGSMASDFVQDSCAGKTNVLLEKFGEITGKCPAKGAIKSLAYEGESYSSLKLNAAYKAAQKAYKANVYALMCGEGFSGLLSTYQAKFWVLGKLIPHKSKQHDGMVEFQSCAVGFPEAKFGESYRDRFYRTKLNHFDMQFLAGDSLLNEAKMPVKWFECLL